jgi:hypothetical protein
MECSTYVVNVELVVTADRCQERFASSIKLRTLWRADVRLRGHSGPRGRLVPSMSKLYTTPVYSGWLRAGWPRGGSSSPNGGKNFHFSISSRPALGPTQSSIQWVRGALSPGVKWPGREADNSRPTSAEVNKIRIYTSTLPYVSMV